MELAPQPKRRFLNVDAVLTPGGEYQQGPTFVVDVEQVGVAGTGRDDQATGFVELVGADGEILQRSLIPIAPVCAHPVDGAARLERPLLAVSGQVPYDEEARVVRVGVGAEPMFELAVPDAPPSVEWSAAEEVDGRLRLSWAAKTSGDAPLLHMVYLTSADSRTRLPVLAWTTEQAVELDGTGLPGGDVDLILVTTDGFYTTESRVTLRRPPQPPVLVVLSPGDGDVIAADVPTSFAAVASDPDSGFQPLRFLEWSSSLDGPLGCGASLQATLSRGLHEITLVGTADDRQGSTRISVAVGLEATVKTERLFRRREGSDVWHWCANCSNWPGEAYAERDTKPRSGELCDECRGKDRQGRCEPAEFAD